MPAKPKRGTVPSLDGLRFRQTHCVSKAEISFPHNFPHGARTLGTFGNTRHYYVCAIPHISAHPHTDLFYSRGETLYVGSKDTKQKNTTRIRRDAYLCAGAYVSVRVCGNVRKSENQHSSYICALFSCAGSVRILCVKLFLACTFARGMLSHARKALRTPFPLSQSG